jgi:hypothetical protein
LPLTGVHAGALGVPSALRLSTMTVSAATPLNMLLAINKVVATNLIWDFIGL